MASGFGRSRLSQLQRKLPRICTEAQFSPGPLALVVEDVAANLGHFTGVGVDEQRVGCCG